MMSSYVSTSAAEALAILRNWRNSACPFLLNPSAIFEGIEITARNICEVKTYVSDFGSVLVTI